MRPGDAPSDPSLMVEAVFERVRSEKMTGLGCLNPVLSVQAVGFRLVAETWIGALVTPWSMNLLLLPAKIDRSTWPPAGEAVEREFPSGSYRFVGAENDTLGRYLTCSLFSPMDEFGSHAVAVEVAQASLALLLTTEAVPQTRTGRSRRAFLGIRA